MAQARVVIIGCGFAGMAALDILSRYRREAAVTLIDKSAHTHFLPLLPDVIGRNIQPGHLTFPIADVALRDGVTFLNEAVTGVDLQRSVVALARGDVPYDYLLIASGTETNFYNNGAVRQNAYKLDDACDAASLRRALIEREFSAHIISGGGYTGVEIATNLRRHLNARGLKRRIIVVERAPSILGPLAEWMKAFVSRNLAALDIEIAVNTVITSVNADEVVLSTGETLRQAQLIWAAGVRTGDYLQKLAVEKNPQGRMKVDQYLRLDERCFAAGDAALFFQGGQPLRMSVMFAIGEGVAAAANIVHSARGEKLAAYRPFDPGYIIPMANNVSCGSVMGRDVRGHFATMCHYLLCVYRSYGMRNQWGVVRDLLRRN